MSTPASATNSRIFHILLCLLCCLLLQPAVGQHRSDTTRVMILGLIHTGNQHFKHQTLYATIRAVQPQLILWEYDVPFKQVWGLRTAHRLRIARPSIEQLALQQHSRKHKAVPIEGFDTTIRYRKRYLHNKVAMEQAFYDRLSQAKKSVADSTAYASFIQKHNHYYQLILNSTLSHINTTAVVALSRELYHLEETVLLPLGRQYINDEALVAAFEKQLQFWKARNRYMARQISRYATKYPGATILVLTGLNHKYFLTDEVPQQLAALSHPAMLVQE